MWHARVIVQCTVRSFPPLGIVEPKLFRLRLLGRSYRILEWNLRDGHELGLFEPGLSVRHEFPPLCCIQLSEDDPANGVATSYLYFRIFPAIMPTTNGLRLRCVNICKMLFHLLFHIDECPTDAPEESELQE
jgi:hypothetical protein